MGFEKNYLEIDLSTGSTFDIALEAEYNIVYVKGTAGGNVTIGVTGTPRKGMEVSVIFSGNSGVHTLTILGGNVPVQSNSVKAKYDYFFNGSTWIALFIPSTDTAYVNNDQVLANAAIELTKLANLTAERIPQINASGKIEASSTNISYLALLGAITVSASQINNVGGTMANTADLNVIAGAAAAGITPTEIQYLIGVTSNLQTQLNAKANSADFSGLVEIKSFSVTIPSAQVLTLNSVPVTLIPAQGAGLKIVPISLTAQIDYNSVAYATNGIVSVFNGGSYGVARVNANAFLFSTVSRTVNIQIANATIVTDTQYVANAPLTLQVEVGNPTAGDSDIIVSGLYIVTT